MFILHHLSVLKSSSVAITTANFDQTHMENTQTVFIPAFSSSLICIKLGKVAM